jgi:ABC-type oligopeptide transport system substrate-binding subunit
MLGRSKIPGLVATSLGLGLLVFVLARADTRSEKPFPDVEILYNTSESHKQIAEALAQMWKDALGVNVVLANKEWKVYLESMDSLQYTLARAGWVWDYNDPHNMFECWTTGNGNNRTGFASPRYDELIALAMLEQENKKRWELYRQAEEILRDEAPILPLYFYVNKNMLSPKVKGWHDNVLNLHPYDEIWIEKEGVPAPPEEQRLVFNNATEPETLDPAVMSGVSEHHTAMCLFEGLVRLEGKSLRVSPGVAERWEVSEDGKTYAFHLREDARWSNGDPVTAQDFVDSWLRVIDPKGLSEPAKYAQVFDWIEGAKPVIRGEKPLDRAAIGVRADGPRTLLVKLATPCPFFLNLCAFPTYNPVHRATVEKHGDRWTRPENIVSNGPFRLVDWKMNAKLVFAPNPHYWGRDRVKLSEITFLPIDSQDTALNKFLAGEIDWIDDVPIARAEEVKRHPHFRRSPFLAIYYYRFNTTKPPFDDVRVRRAFSMAVDKRTICSRVQRFGEIPAGGVIPRGCGDPPYESVKGLPYDVEAARKLLREAGYAVKGRRG